MRVALALTLVVVSASLTGCGTNTINTATTTTVSSLRSVGGSVYGGEQPIGYANVQIWQVGATGYGAGATPLIPSGSYYAGGATGCVASSSQVCYPGVVTTPAGSFNITGDYSCMTGTELYITATGGQASPGQTNSAIALIAGYGPCGSASNNAKVTMNELTTIGSIYALAPFMPTTPATTPWTIGTSMGNAIGLTNAFSDIGTLVNIASGNANTSTATVNLPASELNTLGNVLASCVNSTSSSSPGCTALFNLTPNADGSTPTDTVSAALNIVRNPGRSVPQIVMLQPTVSPFQPSLASATDLTVAVTYTGGGLSAPTATAIDASGNVWVANAGASAATSSVTELSHTGAVLSGVNGYAAGSLNLPSAIAIDGLGNAWIANGGNNTVTELGSNGSNVGSSPYSGGGLAAPTAIAIDGFGNVWLSNSGNSSASEFSSSGAALSGSGFLGTGINAPVGIAISQH